MTWDDIDDVLYDGTREAIKKLKCPDCGGVIHYRYEDEYGAMEVKCVSCGYCSKSRGGPKPRCAEIFGSDYTIK